MVDGRRADAEPRAMDPSLPVPEQLLDALVAGIRAVLGGDLIGIFLTSRSPEIG
jgi:hypothetical protein